MLQNTQDPTKHLSELRPVTSFPENHLRSESWQKSSALIAAAACDDLHVCVGRDRFPVPDVISGVSRNTPEQV